MVFNFRQFFDSNQIPYITHGPNVAHGNLNLRCPFCGPDDPSHHMGINPKTGDWGCWRNPDHRGKKPFRLIKALTNLPSLRVQEIIGEPSIDVDTDLKSVIDKLRPGTSKEVRKAPLSMPNEFKPITLSASARRFISYLNVRGYENVYLTHLRELYDIRYAYLGDYYDRIIFPIRLNGALVNWSARTIHSNGEPRYKQLPREDTSHVSSDLIWNFDDLQANKGQVLFITEGPFDALKIDLFGSGRIRATCVFGSNVSEAQRDLITMIAPNFQRITVLMDTSNLTLRAMSVLANLDPKVGVLPYGRKDPGELNPSEVQNLAS